jgi:hypothetical protein
MHVTSAFTNPHPNADHHSLISGEDFQIIKRGGLYVKNHWLGAEQVAILRDDIASLRQCTDSKFSPSGLSNRVAGDSNSFGSSDRLTCTITPQLPGGTNRLHVEVQLNELKHVLERQLGIPKLELAEQYYSISPTGAHLARHMDERHEETKGEKAWDVLETPTRRSISWLLYLNGPSWTGGGEFLGYCRRSTCTSSLSSSSCGSNDGDLQVGWLTEKDNDDADGFAAPVFLDSWIKTPTTTTSRRDDDDDDDADDSSTDHEDELEWCPMLALYRISNDGKRRVYLSDPFGPTSPTWPSSSSSEEEMDDDDDYWSPETFANALASQLHTKYDRQLFTSVESISGVVVTPIKVVPLGGTLVLFDSVAIPHEVLATTTTTNGGDDDDRLALAGWFHEPTQAFPDWYGT